MNSAVSKKICFADIDTHALYMRLFHSLLNFCGESENQSDMSNILLSCKAIIERRSNACLHKTLP